MDDFYEDDEDPAKVWAAFNAAEKHKTRPPESAERAYVSRTWAGDWNSPDNAVYDEAATPSE